MNKIYYIGTAVVLILIVVVSIILVKALSKKSGQENQAGLLPEEIAQQEAKVQGDEASKPVQSSKSNQSANKKTSTPASSNKIKTPKAKKAAAKPQYEYYMEQTQKITIILPEGGEYTQNCTNKRCEIIIYP